MESEANSNSTNAVSNQTVSSSTVVTKRNQIFTQQIVTSRRVISSNSASGTVDKYNNNSDVINMETSDNNNANNNNCSVVSTVVSNNNGVKSTKIITRTYRRRIIRRTGPDGEVTEQIIEEGDPIEQTKSSSSDEGQQALSTLENTKQTIDFPNFSSETTGSGAKFQAVAGFKSISETGEEQSGMISTGPIQANFLPSSGASSLSITDGEVGDSCHSDQTDGMQLCAQSNPGNTVQQVLPDGTIVTKRVFSKQSAFATVTKSSTVNGETKTSTKSAFMCLAGESLSQAQSSMNDMEDIFKQMMISMSGSAFNILDKFIICPTSDINDHLALAGGDSQFSLLALETPHPSHEDDTNEEKGGLIARFLKPTTPKAICPPEAEAEAEKQVSSEEKLTIEKQQEEAAIAQKIRAIKEDTGNRKGLFWSNMDEVKSSGLLDKMRKEQIHLQEAMFEFITSEASYNISLDMLIEHYYNSDLLNPKSNPNTISQIEKRHLFSNILLVKCVSVKLLQDLEKCWSQQKPTIINVADVIAKHAQDPEFQTNYVAYLRNQSYQINVLKTLLHREAFKQAVQSIQGNPRCGKLSLDSFLALPMQRLTRMKLLLEVVMKLMRQCEEIYKTIPANVIECHDQAISLLKDLLKRSEEEKFKTEQKARLLELTKYVDFGSTDKTVALGSKELLKEGELRVARVPKSWNALKKLNKKNAYLYVIVLNDMVILSKKKSNTKFVVLYKCDKDRIVVSDYVTPDNSNQTLPRDKSIGSQMSILSKDSNDNLNALSALNAFSLLFPGECTEPLILIAKTNDSKNQWTSAIKENRVEN